MAAIRERDIPAGERAWQQWNDAAQRLREDGADSESLTPTLPRPTWAMAVRYTLYLLERKAPGPGVEVRVAPWGAVKILDGPASDPHNLTPPDVIELDPEVWLRLAAGITTSVSYTHLDVYKRQTVHRRQYGAGARVLGVAGLGVAREIGRASCREGV